MLSKNVFGVSKGVKTSFNSLSTSVRFVERFDHFEQNLDIFFDIFQLFFFPENAENIFWSNRNEILEK